MSLDAISSARPAEIILVDQSASGVKCNGGNESLGHPLVYYAFDGNPSICCGYCGRIFTKQTS